MGWRVGGQIAQPPELVEQVGGVDGDADRELLRVDGLGEEVAQVDLAGKGVDGDVLERPSGRVVAGEDARVAARRRGGPGRRAPPGVATQGDRQLVDRARLVAGRRLAQVALGALQLGGGVEEDRRRRADRRGLQAALLVAGAHDVGPRVAKADRRRRHRAGAAVGHAGAVAGQLAGVVDQEALLGGRVGAAPRSRRRRRRNRRR